MGGHAKCDLKRNNIHCGLGNKHIQYNYLRMMFIWYMTRIRCQRKRYNRVKKEILNTLQTPKIVSLNLLLLHPSLVQLHILLILQLMLLSLHNISMFPSTPHTFCTHQLLKANVSASSVSDMLCSVLSEKTPIPSIINNDTNKNPLMMKILILYKRLVHYILWDFYFYF